MLTKRPCPTTPGRNHSGRKVASKFEMQDENMVDGTDEVASSIPLKSDFTLPSSSAPMITPLRDCEYWQ